MLEGDKGGGGIESRNWVRGAVTVWLSIETTVISILVGIMAGPLGRVGSCLARDLVTVSGSSLTVVSSAFPRIRR